MSPQAEIYESTKLKESGPMTVKVNTNGQARKSLAEQIDRLDAMLDGLADGLNDAVAMVVKEAVGVAVKEAMQAVLREALANPELLARLLPPCCSPRPRRSRRRPPPSAEGELEAALGRRCVSPRRFACPRPRRVAVRGVTH